jgi:hypothetical protein
MYKSGGFVLFRLQVGTLDQKKIGAIVLLLVLAVTLTAVSYAGLGSSCNVPAKGSMTLTVQGDNHVYMSDGASIPFKWGTINIGQNTKTVTVTNHANVNLQAHLAVTAPSLPRGWTLSFSLDNQVVSAGRSATGTLTLRVPVGVHVGNYNWGASILFEAAKK